MSASDINNLINTLAEKLGPLGKVVWDSYIRQQIVIGCDELVWAVVLAGVAIGAVTVTVHCWRDEEFNSENGPVGFFVVGCVIAPTAFLAALGLGLDAVGHLANPQYGAIQALLGR
jgi:hypothetical protein